MCVCVIMMIMIMICDVECVVVCRAVSEKGKAF